MGQDVVGLKDIYVLISFVLLPCLGSLAAAKHGTSQLLGLVMGVVAWIAVISGVLIVLMVVDLFDCKIYPNRQGIGLLGSTVVISVFVAATGGTAALYWVLCAR
jgi:hypothetical protein